MNTAPPTIQANAAAGGPPSPIRVLVVDDHALVREGTRSILQGQPDIDVVGEAERGDLALQLLDRMQVDVVLLDVRMSGISGIETTRRIHAAFPAVRVLILSAYVDQALEAFQAGACGYLLKTVSSRELLAAVRSVFYGATVVQGAVAETLNLWGSGTPSNRAGTLSTRETEILRLIVRGLTNRAIAREVGIAPRTADQHVHSIFIKAGVKSRAEAVRYALVHGLASEIDR
jgi:DNA-binding NarL/FixJ family response regulator